MCNPLFLTGNSDAEIITMLHPLADKLIHFGYTRFTEEFISTYEGSSKD